MLYLCLDGNLKELEVQAVKRLGERIVKNTICAIMPVEIFNFNAALFPPWFRSETSSTAIWSGGTWSTELCFVEQVHKKPQFFLSLGLACPDLPYCEVMCFSCTCCNVVCCMFRFFPVLRMKQSSGTCYTYVLSVPSFLYSCCICTVFLLGIVFIALEPGRNDIVAVIAGAVCKVSV